MNAHSRVSNRTWSTYFAEMVSQDCSDPAEMREVLRLNWTTPASREGGKRSGVTSPDCFAPKPKWKNCDSEEVERLESPSLNCKQIHEFVYRSYMHIIYSNSAVNFLKTKGLCRKQGCGVGVGVGVAGVVGFWKGGVGVGAGVVGF